jgi:outer membrane protein
VRLVTVILLVAWASVAQSADISIRVQDAPAQGVLVFQIYDSANTFGDFRDPILEVRTDIRPDSVYLVEEVPAGEIAMLVYVDENENGLIDKNFIGIPKEALGISNNYRPKGPPSSGRAQTSEPANADTPAATRSTRSTAARLEQGGGRQ